jgi:hypothetical protein
VLSSFLLLLIHQYACSIGKLLDGACRPVEPPLISCPSRRSETAILTQAQPCQSCFAVGLGGCDLLSGSYRELSISSAVEVFL